MEKKNPHDFTARMLCKKTLGAIFCDIPYYKLPSNMMHCFK